MRVAGLLCLGSAALVAAKDGMVAPKRELQGGPNWHCDRLPVWNDQCADAHIFGVGDHVACDSYQITDADINTPCGTPEKPCLTAYVGIPTFESPNCGKCFEMTILEDGKSYMENGDLDPIEAVCKVDPASGTCGAYERTVQLKAMDETSAANFEVAQNAWEYLCPYCCYGSSVCVLDPAICVHGIFDENWRCAYKAIKYHEVECGAPCPLCGVESSTTTSTTVPGGGSTTTKPPSGGAPPVVGSSSTGASDDASCGVEEGKSGTVGPVVYSAGNDGACGDKISEADLSGGCGTAANPCVAAYEEGGWGKEDCGKCFYVTMKEAGGGTNVCTAETGCPVLENSIYVKVVDQITASTFGVNQDGWKSLCPFVCVGDICVENESSCVSAVAAETSSPKPATYQAVECGKEVVTSCPDSGGMKLGGMSTMMGACAAALTMR